MNELSIPEDECGGRNRGRMDWVKGPYFVASSWSHLATCVPLA